MSDFETSGDELSLDDSFSDDFEPVVSGTQQTKFRDVEYKCFSPMEIGERQSNDVSHLSALLSLPPTISSELLKRFKYNKERAVESYMEDPDRALTGYSALVRQTIADFMCDICCIDGTVDTLSLSCKHAYCFDCFTHYTTDKIRDGEHKILCPGPKCPLIVSESDLKSFLSTSVIERYSLNLLRAYVNETPSLKFCPAPNCEYIIECHIPQSQFNEIVPTVTCKCSHAFCFSCQMPDHLPAPCFLTTKWVKKCKDDSETANWIAANTKECTKCHATIEKNGGCNHMTCKKCKYEFCWVCSGPWSEHGTGYYQCNRFDNEESVKARTDQEKFRAALKRYLHVCLSLYFLKLIFYSITIDMPTTINLQNCRPIYSQRRKPR